MKKLLNILIALILTFTLSACNESKEIPVVPEKDEKPAMPTLDVEVTEDMDFFKDGYEIVEVVSYGDGDTTTFRLDTGDFSTRYLAMDTPETSNGIEPWGVAAKNFLNDTLKEAEEIILERDPVLVSNKAGEDDATFDRYSRLLAHVWVDGELLQYKMVEESLANVAYLYFDYKYNDTLIKLESYVREKDDRRVHNPDDLDPDFNYSNDSYTLDISELSNEHVNQTVTIEAVVTGLVGYNPYLELNGHGVYVYAQNALYKNFVVGNKVKITGTYTSYNNQMQITNLTHSPELISEGNAVEPMLIEVDGLNVDNESLNVRLNDVTIDKISDENVYGTVEDTEVIIRFDEDMHEYAKPSDLEVGQTYDFIGNVGRYQNDFQLMIRNSDDILEK